jgi:hypothetical protein
MNSLKTNYTVFGNALRSVELLSEKSKVRKNFRQIYCRAFFLTMRIPI